MSKQLRLVFLYGMETHPATEQQIEEFKAEHYQFSDLSKRQRIKTDSINATFEHYNDYSNTVYLREL